MSNTSSVGFNFYFNIGGNIRMEKKYCIYIHINKINKKVYIGQTCQKPEQRWRNGLGYRKNISFFEDIQKYGWENFKHKIIGWNLTAEQADIAEEQLISLFNSTNPLKGYNKMNKNRNGFHFTDLWENQETRNKIVQTLKKQRNTTQYKEKQSQKMKECWEKPEYREKQKNAWTEERKKQTSQRSKKNWESPEYREKIVKAMSERQKEKWQDPEYRRKKCKRVQCIETGEIFPSLVKAAEFAGVKPNSLCACLKTKTHQSGHHPITKKPLHWRRVEEKEGSKCGQVEQK